MSDGLVVCNVEVVPMYLVSPQLFVTREHIMSESSSTASSFSSCGFPGGEKTGVGTFSACGVLCGDCSVRGWLLDFELCSESFDGVPPLE